MSQGNKLPFQKYLISGYTMGPEIVVEQNQVSRAKQGDLNAFEALIKKYQKMIYGLCLRLTGNHQAADDLTQETFLKAFVGLPHFLDDYDFYPWLRKIALNLCFSYLRKTKREARLGTVKDFALPIAIASSIKSPVETLEKLETEKEFQHALYSLPHDQRIIFILKTYENLSYQEIADMMDLRLGTVMSRLNRARKKLRHRLASYLGEKR